MKRTIKIRAIAGALVRKEFRDTPDPLIFTDMPSFHGPRMAAGTPQLLWPDRIDQAVLDEVVSRIVRAVDPERIVLFGSHARGSAGTDSDLDLLVVMDSPLPRHRRVVPILKALAGIMVPKDVVAYTPAEVEEWRGVREAFITSILAEGRTLYAKNPS